MANLTDSPVFVTGVYQLELSDPVIGGPGGMSNRQPQELANRTAYLKQHVDALEAGSLVPPGIATENFVQSELAKLDHKQSVRVATTGNITLSATQTIDGITVAVGDRVLVKNQTTALQNGIYVVSDSAWTRSADANISAEVTPGLEVAVEQGTLLADTRWKLTTDGPITLDSTALTFVDITAGYAPLNSPAFTGSPTAPTPATGVRSIAIATMQKFADEFAASLAGNGYQKLPSGLIIQWGSNNTPGVSTGTITFPIAFPTATISCWGNDASAGATVVGTLGFGASTNTNVVWYGAQGAVAYSSISQFFWYAIGY